MVYTVNAPEPSDANNEFDPLSRIENGSRAGTLDGAEEQSVQPAVEAGARQQEWKLASGRVSRHDHRPRRGSLNNLSYAFRNDPKRVNRITNLSLIRGDFSINQVRRDAVGIDLLGPTTVLIVAGDGNKEHGRGLGTLPWQSNEGSAKMTE